MTPAIIGQELAKAQIAGLGAQAIALVGPQGVGRRLVAAWYAAKLNCRRPDAAPCGQCESCRSMPDEHPDYREIMPADTTSTGRAKRQREFRIDQLVERPKSTEEPVSVWLGHRPRFSWRVVVIDEAEALNAHAANAFLKLLEEPPSWARILLIAPSMDALLPTIASRCTPVRCAPVVTKGFEDLAPHPALATGRIGPLARARREPDRYAEVRAAVETFVRALEGPLADTLEASDALETVWADHDAADVSDLLRFTLHARHPTHVPAIEREIERCERAYEHYANTTLATRVLALALRHSMTSATP